MGKDNKTVNINLRVTDKTKRELEKLANLNQRTLSDYIRLYLEKLVETRNKK